MAIHRTKQEKMRAVARRKEQLSLVQPSVTSHTAVAVDTQEPVRPRNGLTAEMQRNASFLRADLTRTMVVTAVLMTILIGIWWLNRYNGILGNL